MLAWEPETQALWTTLSKHSSDIVDIGAYLGFYSLAAHKENPSANIFSFEPNPNTYQNLLLNLAENEASPLLRSFNVALGIDDDLVYLDIPPGRKLSSGTRISRAKRDNIVKQVKLDSVVEKAQLIKIDTEGFESEILQGACVLLKESAPSLILEILSAPEFERLKSFTLKFGYPEPAILESSNGALGRFVEAYAGPRNYFFPGKYVRETGLLKSAFHPLVP